MPTNAAQGVAAMSVTKLSRWQVERSTVSILYESHLLSDFEFFDVLYSYSYPGSFITVQGIGPNIPTWLRLQNVEGGTFNNPTSIIVDISVLNQWLPGAVLLITSHTRRWNDHQVRQIVSVSEASGYARIDLNSTIRRPTTIVESADFAVEVALLSRNIVLEGGQGLQDGGHLWIFQTPNVVQSIVGVDIQHFGQQGTLGRCVVRCIEIFY